jgi:hypothetical protein
LLDEGFKKKAWHGPTLSQALRGVNARQAAWRPAPGRHNIWEEALHAAYWKYMVRRRISPGQRADFPLAGQNFFPRPEKGRASDAAWRSDKRLLDREHRLLVAAVKKALARGLNANQRRNVMGVAFHDVYHAGQIRLLRRLQERRAR